MPYKICDIEKLSELQAEEFLTGADGQKRDAFVFRYQQQFYAYENSCPHTGANLNWQPGQFFSLDGRFLQCSLHGALFEPETGRCVRGPCAGQSLKKVTLTLTADALWLDEAGQT